MLGKHSSKSSTPSGPVCDFFGEQDLLFHEVNSGFPSKACKSRAEKGKLALDG